MSTVTLKGKISEIVKGHGLIITGGGALILYNEEVYNFVLGGVYSFECEHKSNNLYQLLSCTRII